MKHLMAGMMLVASAGLVQAEGSVDSAGLIKGKTSSTYHVISEGHLVVEISNTQTSFEMADPDNPLAGMTGRCTGTMEIRGPAVVGSGICIAQNDAGDMGYINWRGDSFSPEGALNGSWVIVGATGGLSGMAGGGRFSSKTDQATGDYVNTLSGALTRP